MKHYLDKLVLFTICMVLYVPRVETPFAVIPVIAALTISAAGTWLERMPLQAFFLSLFLLISFNQPAFLLFLPLVSYDLITSSYKPVVLFSIAPLVMHFSWIGPAQAIQIIVLILLSWLLNNRFQRLLKLREQGIQLRDETTEQAIALELKNKELINKQDYEVHLATLNERNRIAREIHDNVGHLLTRALLQTGALMATQADENLQKQLAVLDHTLTESMNQVRHSLHDLREGALDLKAGLDDLTDHFEACPIELAYDVSAPPAQAYSLTILAIAREGLSNITRHSDADKAWLTIREHPGFYQLIIRDNGRGCSQDRLEADKLAGASNENLGGIGLQSMRERVSSLKGQINIRTGHINQKGFEIFITIPKKDNKQMQLRQTD